MRWERYANALKEVFDAEKELLDIGYLSAYDAGLVNCEAYLSQRYVRIQNLVDGKKPKNWDVKTFAEIEYHDQHSTPNEELYK